MVIAIGGGKFANGARTAAFAHLLNHENTSNEQRVAAKESWWTRNVVRPWAKKTGIVQYADTPDYYTEEENLLIGFLGSGGAAVPGRIITTVRSSALTANVEKEVFTYAPRVRMCGIKDPKAHNFPYSFDKTILGRFPTMTTESGYRIYQSPGYMNNKASAFEIGVKPNSVIDHRFFRPN